MSSLAVRIPLTRDTGDGFAMIKDFRTLIKQNLKMLLLTHPGERVMAPSYGVGIQKYLWDSFDQGSFVKIEQNIVEQVRTYLPVVSIDEINFSESALDSEKLEIYIRYSILSLNTTDLLRFTI
jgi:phage baseplate assembly protein W